MSNPTSETVVATYTFRGRNFTVTRLTWADTDGLSFDIADEETGAPLHDESFDTLPTTEDLDKLLADIASNIKDDSLSEYLSEHEEDLTEIIEALTLTYEVTIKFVVEAFDAKQAEREAADYLAQHEPSFEITEV